MFLLAFFFLLTLQPHGYGHPTGTSHALGTWNKASEAREPLVARVKRSFPEDDEDYEVYETPTPELMDKDNFTTSPLVLAPDKQQGATSAPITVASVEPTPREATSGKLATEATERRTTSSPLPEELTSGLPSTGQQTTHDPTTEKVVTDVPEMEESTTRAPSPGQQVSNSTPGEVGTVSTTVKSATVTLALNMTEAETVTPGTGQLVTHSATTRMPPTSLPAELKPNHSSPAASLNVSATGHPLHNFSTTFSPASSFNAHSDPPKPEVATRQVGPSNTTALEAVATTAHLFISDQIPVRQCLLAVLILAVIATIFLICTVVLAIRLSKKGHTYPVRDYSPTEMVCISSLLAEGDGPPTANGGPASNKSQPPKPTPGPGEDCDGDDLTLHSFLP